MMTPATARLLEALRAGGDDARFVGGCVRDSLLGRDIHDIDIATDAVPERVVALLEAARIKAVPTGIEHGTVTAVVDGRGFEITTLRRDIATDGRHATVAFGTDWRADAARRDFTINAMSLSPDGTLFDKLRAPLIEEREQINEELAVGLGWHLIQRDARETLVWHNGGTGGYSSFLGFYPEAGMGVVLLTNTANTAAVDGAAIGLLTCATLTW